MLFVDLDCGRRVSVDDFEFSRRYAELIEGRPDAKMNTRIIQNATTSRKRSWGGLPIHLIPPEIDYAFPTHPSLPPMLLRASLTSYQPVRPSFMGSALIAVWFSHDCYEDPLAEIIRQGVRHLNWDELAQDFNW